MMIDAQIDLFGHRTIESIVKGPQRPFTDADGIQHSWYGRCMIAILDAKRWIMALRSGDRTRELGDAGRHSPDHLE